MKKSIRPYVSSGIAVVSVGAFVVAPTAPRDPPVRVDRAPIALAVQAQPLTARAQPLVVPLAVPAPVPSPQHLAGLLNEQVAFHVDLAVDFVAQGAELISHQLPVPGTLLRDIGDGTPVSVAVGRALRTLADVEIDAGGRLVGFAVRYVDFQLRFAASVLQETVAVAATVPAAVGKLVTTSITAPKPTRSAIDEGAADEISAAVATSSPAGASTPVRAHGHVGSAQPGDAAHVDLAADGNDDADRTATSTRHSARVAPQSAADKTTAPHADSQDSRTQATAPTAHRADPAGPAE